MTRGPISIPPYPKVAILAIAVPCDIFLSFAAREKAKGMITAIPNPIKLKAINNGIRDSNVTKIVAPISATNPE